MKIRISLIIAELCLSYGVTVSQELPKVIPPSPSAMQFQKYGDYPVGNFTGVPEINIPLYTIKEGDLELPISLSYHASGFKPTDPNGFCGLGWSLNAGGRVSRTIVDEADEMQALPNPFYTAAQLAAFTYWQLPPIMGPYESRQDTEPDIFSYNFGNHVGKFVLKQDAARTPMLIPYKPLKIVKHQASTSTSIIDYFDITDEQGLQHRFYKAEKPDGNESYTGWNIQRMTSSIDSSNYLDFTYVNGPFERDRKRVDQYIVEDDIISRDICRGDCWGYVDQWTQVCKPMDDFLEYGPGGTYDMGSGLDYTTYVNKEISFRSGKVEFIQNASTRMLESIKIYDRRNALLQTITFEYLQRPELRVLLKAIKFYDRNNRFVNQYVFTYIGEQFGSLPGSQTAGTDYWGFYNADNRPDFLPRWDVYFIGRGTRIIGSSERVSNETAMKTFILERITYPTGGSTLFNFEANRYLGGGQITGYTGDKVGGLRIKEIINYTDQNTVARTKSYVYGAMLNWNGGYGIMDVYPSRQDFSYTQRGYFANGPIEWESFRRVVYSSEPFTELCPHGSPVVYTSVTEYFGDGEKNIGKIEYEYDYNEAEYSTYETNGAVDGHGAPILYRRYLKPVQEWRSGQNIAKRYYKNVNGAYSIVRSEINDYEEVNRESVRGLHMDRFVIFGEEPCGIYTGNKDEGVFTHGDAPPTSVFNYGDYYLESGEKRLRSTTVIDHGTTTTTTYEYGNTEHAQPTKTTRITSKGDNIITTLKYPHDFASTAPYNLMVGARHIWSPIIEQADYKNNISTGSFLSSTRTNYADWGNNIIAPVTVETKKGASPPEVRIRFLDYDARGNLRSVSREKDVVTSYIWGYDKTLPVAEVTGAHYTDISGMVNHDVLNSWLSTEQQVKDQLNSLRNNLAGTKALVNTYTYKPLIGMSSHTDPNGKATYYEYDGSGRLQHIRDEDQNILKKYSYAYLGLNEQGATEANPQWQATGVTRPKLCPINNNFVIGTETQEKDINPASLTYNQFRWTSTGGETGGTAADWQFTATPARCVVDGYGYNTGQLEREKMNINPCSGQYNERRWEVIGTDLTACPRPSSFTSDDRSGEYYSQWCANGEAPNPIYVSVPAGMFTSTISKGDANQQAYNYGQNYANQHGTCFTLPVTINFTNYTGQIFDIYLYLAATQQSFTFRAGGNGPLGEVPAGDYEVRIEPIIGSMTYTFTVGCDNTTTGQTAEFEDIPINAGCNTIVIE